jgi:hypothetical protein
MIRWRPSARPRLRMNVSSSQNRENGPSAGRAIDADLAAVPDDHVTNDREADARALN